LHRSPATATLIASLTAPPSAGGEELAGLPAAVGWLEVRADLVGEIDPGWLRERSGGRRLLYTLRSAAEGGRAEASPGRRRQRLAAAGDAGYDLVDLEGERDTADELLERLPPERRLVSWHGAAADAQALAERFDRLAATPARLYKLVPAAAQPGEDLAPLRLLHSLGRDDVIAFAGGEAGFWSRLVAPRLGAPVVFAAAGDEPAAPGQPRAVDLCRDYGLPQLPPVERLFGIVGNPVRHSLSPRLHNGLYRELGLAALFVPFHAESFGEFWLEIVEGADLEAMGLPLAGLSVTAPFKDAALAVAGAASPIAHRAGAANTLVLRDGVWEAEATDPQGALGALAEHGFALAGAAAAVVGTGGAGRAVAVGLARAGARVTLANRSRERGLAAAHRLGLPFVPLAELDPGAFALLVNATSLGRRGDDPLPFAPDRLAAGAAVVDLVYGRGATPLVAAARSRGLLVVDGQEFLLHQAVPQFRMMTGRDLPLDRGRRLLGGEVEG
jgi:3-dehydroquinate dehydratase / shikimate dehydrogenase